MVDELPDDACARCSSRPPTSSRPASCCRRARRAELLALGGASASAIVIEDDYDAEYRYDRAPVGALQGLRPDLVVHIGSVSKTLAPALRLGWLIAPPALARAAAARARRRSTTGCPRSSSSRSRTSSSAARYDRHLRRSRRAVPAPPRRAARGAGARRCPDATVSGAAAGLHVAVHVPGADEAALVAACREQGVVLDGAAQHGVAPGAGATLLICSPPCPTRPRGTSRQLIAAARGG